MCKPSLLICLPPLVGQDLLKCEKDDNAPMVAETSRMYRTVGMVCTGAEPQQHVIRYKQAGGSPETSTSLFIFKH